jgi:hypothetical protein
LELQFDGSKEALLAKFIEELHKQQIEPPIRSDATLWVSNVVAVEMPSSLIVKYTVDIEENTILLLDIFELWPKSRLVDFLSQKMSGDNMLNYQDRHLN